MHLECVSLIRITCFLERLSAQWKYGKNLSILDSKCFSTIQNKVDSFISPPDIGRIPSKVMSGFSGFYSKPVEKLDNFFPLFALKGVLERSHYTCAFVC